MEYKINLNTRIKADSKQYIVQTRHRRENPAEDENTHVWRDRAYFTKLDAAARYLLEQFVRESDIPDLVKLSRDLENFKTEITESITKKDV